MKRLGNLTVLLAMVASSLVLSAGPSQAHTISGDASDGYCDWDYSHGINGNNKPETWSARRTTECRYVDADLISYYQGSTPRSKYCSTQTNFAYCQGVHDYAISNVNSRVRAKDWERETWQTLYKFHG